jgi:transcriptional regulator with XRE-family HTH domain
MHIGKLIRIIRVAENISQQSLAAEAHITQGFYHLVETGKRSPSECVLKSICSALGIPLWQLYFLQSILPQDSLFTTSSSASIQRVVEAYPKLAVYIDDVRRGQTQLPYRRSKTSYRQLSLFAQI